MLSFQNEQKAIKASAEKAFDVGQKVMDGKHSSSNEVQKTIEQMKNLTDKTEKLEKEKSEKLQKVLKFLEDMETKSVELASKTDKLNSQLNNANSHLSESISCSTASEVEELQSEINDLGEIHNKDRKDNLTEIISLEKSIKDAGGDPSQFSNITAKELEKIHSQISDKIKQKQQAIKKRI